ncbi:putative myelin protein zero-like protein 2 isoform 2 [Scophthalmus maximus]|uniref:Putative myelin protein zero-like protein 2 isoform 2 n=2 Tax=Scophthalmus maximus TaxID=52904 RepID=A0A2U9B8U8_SCOMX|nr:myelin protein zero-like protein 2 [Scophthalmus maximus]AWP00246.1 putative myelin protein zero-like protein 2 isoform 2 [Scophthalmus maximus]
MYHMILLFVFLGGFLGPEMRCVTALTVYTPSVVEVATGTDVKLRCTFNSSYPVSQESVKVTWYFAALNPAGPKEPVFHYSGMGFPPPGHFRDHVVWSGDVMKKDVSLTLLRVSPRFCGTYICQVHNTPEITGRVGEISLRVVNKTASLDPLGWLLALVDLSAAIV